jgi:hypothetical protein
MATDDKNNYWQPTPSEQPEAEVDPTAQSLQPATEVPEIAPIAIDVPENPPITWNAQEYVHIDKTAGWFVLFILIVLALVAVDIFFLKSWTFSALVVVMSVAIVIYIRRPPRTLTYALSPAQGLYVGEKLYHFDDFRAFGLIKDDGNFSIMLIPRKRFSPGVSVFFPEEAGERIVDILGQRLPMEDLKLDFVDAVVRKLRL